MLLLRITHTLTNTYKRKANPCMRGQSRARPHLSHAEADGSWGRIRYGRSERGVVLAQPRVIWLASDAGQAT